VENLAIELHEKYDITLFLGVLYHAPNMIEYLTNVFHVTKKVCIIETLVDALSEPTARAALYAPSEINNDSSNWWAPNLKALAIMLRRVGFSRIDFMNIWYLNSKDKTSKIAWEEPVTTGRVVLHAYV
jgi:tRNA (mo5U34)-methyltransferase